uniref:C2H2-type domain-containing protein n=1 Tax=Bicosoecida sp. CB-2014 TaxID=1486930 RepID=A0A7S1CF17_9STRA
MEEATTPARPRFTFALVRKGNNSRPVRRALERRSAWFRDITAEPAKADDREGGEGKGKGGEGGCADGTCPFRTFNLEQTGKIWDANLVWKFMMTPLLLPPVDFARGARDAARRQAVSHMLGVARTLITKDALVRTMAHAGVRAGEPGPDVTAPVLTLPAWMPETVVVTVRRGVAPAEWRGWREFCAAHAAHAAAGEGRNMWLLKPTSANRGMGIEIVGAVEEARAHLARASKSAAAAGGDVSFILQKYLEEPMLVGGRKFDVRIWALLVDAGGRDFRVYVFPEGYVRTSSNAYSVDAADKFVHLTNYCLQSGEGNESFGAHEAGNTLTFAELDSRCGGGGGGGGTVVDVPRTRAAPEPLSAAAIAASSGPERCPTCGARFGGVEELIAHVTAYHDSAAAPAPVAGAPPAAPHAPRGSGREVCPHCGDRFSDPVELVGHVEAVHRRAEVAAQHDSRQTCAVS